MAERRRLLWISVYAVLATVAVWTIAPGGVAGVLLAPLVLFCPGYALVRAVQGLQREDSLETAVLVVALSFATTALGGLVLQAAGIGLTARSWSVLLLVVTAPACLLGAHRAEAAIMRRRAAAVRRRPAPRTVATVAATVVLLAAAGVLARSGALHVDSERSTTALAALAGPAKSSTVRLFVANADRAPASFRVEIDAGGHATSFPLALRPGQSWSGTRKARRRSGEIVTVRLFRSGSTVHPMRTVTLD